ncbi:MAG TPA: hypothetical protein VGN83_15805 [Falsiroseomonas sp.]|jgi:ribosomal protein S27E|nr:hypothetical protein [Falsiroseomonas sp.]
MISDLVLYGWGPGEFIGMRCCDCQQEQVNHDRRATRCGRCAIAARDAAKAKASLSSTRPRDILERLRDWPSLSVGLDQLHADAAAVIARHRADLALLRAEAVDHEKQPARLPLADAGRAGFGNWGKGGIDPNNENLRHAGV